MTHPDYAARPDCAAGALFVDDEGRVLIVEPTYKPRWEIPELRKFTISDGPVGGTSDVPGLTDPSHP